MGILLGMPLLSVAADDSVAERVEASAPPVPASRPPVTDKKAREELQQLLDRGLALLVPELVRSGTFYPFAAVLGNDDEIRLLGVAASERLATPEATVSALVERVQRLASERRIRAAAFFMDYVAQRRDTEYSQAGVRVELSHRHPDALSVFVPYRITADQKLRLLTPQYRPGKNLVFTPK